LDELLKDGSYRDARRGCDELDQVARHLHLSAVAGVTNAQLRNETIHAFTALMNGNFKIQPVL